MDEFDDEELIGADELNEFINQNFENLINEGYEILKLILELPPCDCLTGEEFIRVNSWITKSEELLGNFAPNTVSTSLSWRRCCLVISSPISLMIVFPMLVLL